MVVKNAEKEKALALRRQGWSYREILERVPVAKSTLSLWLRGVGLSKPQKQRLTQKRLQAIQRGGLAKRNQRLRITEKILRDATADIESISDRELLLIGTALYWAEGSKQKAHDPSVGVIFGNSDPLMVRVILKWLRLIGVQREDVSFSIYLHRIAKDRTEEVRGYWSKMLGLSITKLQKVYFKGNNGTFRKNTGSGYHGLLRVTVARSTNLNRRILGWTIAIGKK